MLTIGEFSRICFVTKKTLRYYDEIGLLRPEFTAENGYRYYRTDQLRTMLLISRLKNYGFSLPEIATVLANPNEDYLHDKLMEKRTILEEKMEQSKLMISALDQDAEKLKRRIDIMDQQYLVKTIELAPETVYSIRNVISIKEFPDMFAKLFAAITQNKLTPKGAPMVFYHQEDFNPEASDMEFAIPVAGEGDGVRTMPGGSYCFATLLGPYVPEAFTAAYAALCSWIDENGYRINGAPFDKYVRGGDMCAPEDYVTEIYFPIAKRN